MGRMSEDREPAEDLRQTAELSLIRVLVEAHIAGLPREEALQYLECCAAILATQEEMSHVVRIRRTLRQGDVVRAEALARVAFSSMIDVWLARIRT